MLGRLLVLTMGLVLASAGIGAAESAEPDVRRVLILYEHESTLRALIEVSRGLHRSLHRRAPTQTEFYSEYLDLVRFPGVDHRRRQVERLSAKYGDLSLDTVLTVGPGALEFLLEYRDEVAPGLPLIFGGVTAEQVKGVPPEPDIYGVVSHFDLVETVRLADRLQPDATRVVVVTGSGTFDRDWEATARRNLGERIGRLDVSYVSGLSLEGFKDVARGLSRDTILVILTVFQDAEGRKYVPRDVAAEIAAVSGAPTYAVYSSHIGIGVVGGVMPTFESIGEDMAALTNRVMGGAAMEPRIVESAASPVMDWRQLRRWNIDESLLPANTKLEYFEPSIWEQYRLEILAAGGVILLQSAMIAGLVVTDRRRRRVSEELARKRLELAHLSRTVHLGALSGSLAHELNQPLTAILANAEVGAHLLEKEPADRAAIKEILRDIIADDRRASEVIKNLRELMLKGEANFDRIDLNQAVRDTVELVRSEMVARGTKVEFTSDHPTLPVNGNLVQVKQIVLNLIMNAAEAMSSLPVSQRRIEIVTKMRDDGLAELAVADSGPGLSAEVGGSVVKPFVTTKPGGLGLGLAICRAIAQAHGGTLEFDERREVGARIILALPVA